MTIVAGDILRTSCNFTLPDGTLYQNVFHHKRSGVGILSDQTHLDTLETWAEDMYAELASQVDEDTGPALSTVDLVEWSVDEWVIVENIGTFLPTIAFGNVVDPMPNQLSPFVVFKTPRPKTVGRKFLFPFAEDQYTAGVLAPAAVAAMVAWADDAVNNLTLQVLDYLVPGVPRTGVNDWQEFYVAILGNIAGTQRRRRRGVGA